jgi:hypothetical protein
MRYEVCRRAKIICGALVSGTAVLLFGAQASLLAAGNCSFKRSPAITLRNMGPCQFDIERLSFTGDPEQQATCLLTPVQRVGRLGPSLRGLPSPLAGRVGQSVDQGVREALRKVLVRSPDSAPVADSLDRGISSARDQEGRSHRAQYFVIHDTSSPNFANLPWPKNIDTDAKINDLRRYACDNDIERAHAFVNRAGAIFMAHDFDVPWRATKFEMATNFAEALKGLFLHIELIQPRRRDPRYRGRNDFLAPEPGFTEAQYDSLALLYATASVRAGAWLIPAFHAVIDEGIRDKHDDPQNFELARFADSLERLLARLKVQDATVRPIDP